MRQRLVGAKAISTTDKGARPSVLSDGRPDHGLTLALSKTRRERRPSICHTPVSLYQRMALLTTRLRKDALRPWLRSAGTCRTPRQRACESDRLNRLSPNPTVPLQSYASGAMGPVVHTRGLAPVHRSVFAK